MTSAFDDCVFEDCLAEKGNEKERQISLEVTLSDYVISCH